MLCFILYVMLRKSFDDSSTILERLKDKLHGDKPIQDALYLPSFVWDVAVCAPILHRRLKYRLAMLVQEKVYQGGLSESISD